MNSLCRCLAVFIFFPALLATFGCKSTMPESAHSQSLNLVIGDEIPQPMAKDMQTWLATRNSFVDERQRFLKANQERIEKQNAEIRSQYTRIKRVGGAKVAIEKDLQTLREQIKIVSPAKREQLKIKINSLDNMMNRLRQVGLNQLQPIILSYIGKHYYTGQPRPDPIEPTDDIVIYGTGFGASPGQVTLNFVDPTWGNVSVTLSVKAWQQDLIWVEMPALTGYVDQPANLKVITSNGFSDNTDSSFIATRDYQQVYWNGLHSQCSKTTDDDFCGSGLICKGGQSGVQNSGQYELGFSFGGYHFSECCYNDVKGTDHWYMDLKNGWVLSTIDFYSDGQGEQTKDIFGLLLYGSQNPGEVRNSAVSYDNGTKQLVFGEGYNGYYENWYNLNISSADLQIDWWVDEAGSSVDYQGVIGIVGPLGVPYADDNNPPPKAWPGGPCTPH
jgi:hypothetical protein